MNTQVRDVGMVVMAIVIMVSVFMGLKRVDKNMQIKAMSECGKLATYAYEYRGTSDTGDQTVTRTLEPNHGLYKTCMEDMGYQTKIKE